MTLTGRKWEGTVKQKIDRAEKGELDEDKWSVWHVNVVPPNFDFNWIYSISEIDDYKNYCEHLKSSSNTPCE